MNLKEHIDYLIQRNNKLDIKLFNSTQEWLDARRNGIGGSDLGVILDISPYQTRDELIAKKKYNNQEFKSNPITEFGNFMEKAIFDQEVKQTYPDAVLYEDTIITNSDVPFLQASPDGFIDDNTILEIKFINLMGYAKWYNENGELAVPSYYRAQVMHYMMVTETKQAKLFAYFQHLAEAKVFTIDYNEAEATMIAEQCADFMKDLEAAPETEAPLETVTDIIIPKGHPIASKLLSAKIEQKQAKMKYDKAVTDLTNSYEVGSRLKYGDATIEITQLKNGKSIKLK